MDGRQAVSAVFVAMLGATSAMAAEAIDRVTLAVAVQNYDPAAESLLDEARAQASAIYETAGVALEWKHPGEARVTLVILPKSMADHMPSGDEDLGMTPTQPTGERSRRAYVFSERVRAAARALHTAVGQLLGCALAHELGHMLLPLHAHTENGIMRGRWDPAHFAMGGSEQLTFNSIQAQLIRRRVVAMTLPGSR